MLQNLNFKLGALRHEKRRGLAFYTGTSCFNNEFQQLTFVYILKISESKRQIETFCMKAAEMSTMSELKTEKSIHVHYNQFDLVQNINVNITEL